MFKIKFNGEHFHISSIITYFCPGSTISGRSVGRSDSGLYSLMAINSIGMANISVRLTVECKIFSFIFSSFFQISLLLYLLLY